MSAGAKGTGEFTYFVEEEVNRMAVQFRGESLQEVDIVGSDFLVVKIEFMYNYIIHMIIGKEIV